ncbi:hypothetical protein YQE_08225, partial [Dendroctonus ponderosae]
MEEAIGHKTESLCKVCGDKASGKHYGVSSCDGCRGFFKRSIRRYIFRNLEYVCKESGRCVVDVTRRNQCQACRFKKCLQVNMKRDAVQHERAPRSSHPALHYPVDKPTSHIKQDLALRDGRKEDEVSSSEEISQEKRDGTSDGPMSVNARLELPILSNVEPKHAGLVPVDLPCMSVFAENTYESAAKLLFLAIKWARTIPSFLQLSQRDQSILLEESWSELFVLTASQWALPVDEVNNAVAPTSRHPVLEEDARKLREVISRLNMLRVDHTEHACLKALVLFKAESRGLCEPAHVELLQDQTHVMLHEYCAERQSHQKARFGKLLLALPAIQNISRRSLEELLFKQTVGEVAIDKLLGDLAKASYT